MDLVHGARQKLRNFIVSPQERWIRMLAFRWYITVAVVLFFILALVVRNVPYFSIDLIVTKEFQEPRKLPLYPLMFFISWLGYMPQFPVIILFLCLFIFLIGLKWEAVMAFLTGFGSAALAAFIKEFINRPRPSQDLVTVLHHLTDTSFPSGHTITYTAFFGFLWFLTYSLMRHSRLRIILLAVFAGLVVLVGPSRIYLGEHWASDVLGAYLLGSVCLLIAIYGYVRWKTKFFKQQPVAGKSS